MIDEFIYSGWHIAGCARSLEIIKTLRDEYGHDHDFQSVDVSNESEVADWSKKIIQRYGAPDLLINNASVYDQHRPVR